MIFPKTQKNIFGIFCDFSIFGFFVIFFGFFADRSKVVIPKGAKLSKNRGREDQKKAIKQSDRQRDVKIGKKIIKKKMENIHKKRQLIKFRSRPKEV